ncbi:TRAP transporter small permease subunit [Inquilinus sp. CAU 1745]|uniref:TRAP transporter small permease n=1 Tax=Inquilinus sp. CAU 1745 TaxID=3140369 RepID=UPI00325B2C4A
MQLLTLEVGGLLDRASRLCVVVAVGMLFVMSALIVLQVAARNFVDLGLPWANELARFTGIALVYLTTPYLLLRERHIAVDVFSSMLKGRSRLVLRLLTELATLTFAALTLFGAQQFLMRAAKFSTPAMGMPNFIFYLPMVVGTALLFAVALARVVALARGRLPDPEPAHLP